MTTLCDAPGRIVIDCPRCDRHGEYTRESALRKYGDISLEDFVFRVVAGECARLKHPTAPTGCRAHLEVARSRAA